MRTAVTLDQSFELIKLLDKCGFKSRIVGGAVRNFLVQEPCFDVDIATTAIPAQIELISQKENLIYIPLGTMYGSCRLKFKDILYEITTLRDEKNGYENIQFTKSFEIDSQRRDFSINAIYADSEGRFYDYHNGIRDLQNHVVKFIGDPVKRIAEDPLRILRYIRFTAKYGNCNVDSDIKNTIIFNVQLLDQVPKVKLMNELIKIMKIENITEMSDVLSPIFQHLFKVKFPDTPSTPALTENTPGKKRLYAIINTRE